MSGYFSHTCLISEQGEIHPKFTSAQDISTLTHKLRFELKYCMSMWKTLHYVYESPKFASTCPLLRLLIMAPNKLLQYVPVIIISSCRTLNQLHTFFIILISKPTWAPNQPPTATQEQQNSTIQPERYLMITWCPYWLTRSGWGAAKFGFGTGILGRFFLPKELTELALIKSSFLVLLTGIVPSGHLPFMCHNCVIGFGFLVWSSFSLAWLLLPLNSPSGW